MDLDLDLHLGLDQQEPTRAQKSPRRAQERPRRAQVDDGKGDSGDDDNDNDDDDDHDDGNNNDSDTAPWVPQLMQRNWHPCLARTPAETSAKW
eukprot:7934610-Karenia_brevis.AAC.1